MRLEEIVPEFDLLRPSSLRAALQIDLFQHIALADGKLPLSELTAHYHTYDAYVLRLLILSLDEYGYVNVENDLVSLTSKGSLIVETSIFLINWPTIVPPVVCLVMPLCRYTIVLLENPTILKLITVSPTGK